MRDKKGEPCLGRSLVKVSTCLMLAGAVMSPAFAFANTAVFNGSVIVQSQSVPVKGTVKDADGNPIVVATVYEKGTTNGTITDMDGNFSFSVSGSESVVVISFVGYESQEMTIGSNSTINITLQQSNQELDEVVVIGYGTQRKGDVTSSVASVKSEDFNAGNIADAGQLIKGKIAGLSVTNSSGDPTSRSSIMLRGTSTITGSNSPLVLIDGVKGSLSTVAPENIAEIDVLKDASAAAIYGTRGANGVILITTKNGKRNQEAQITYNGYVSFSKWFNTSDFMNTNDVIYGKTNYSYNGYDTDWLKAVTNKAGFKQNHSLSVNGGTKNATYSANVTYSDEEGIMRKSGNEDLKVQLDYTQYVWNDKLKLNFNVLNTREITELNNNAYVYRQAIIHNPSDPVYNSDGSYYEDFNLFNYYNPVEIQNEYEGDTRSNFSQLTGNVTIEPIKGWQTNLMVTSNQYTNVTESFTSPQYYTLAKQIKGGVSYNGYASKSEDAGKTQNCEITSKYAGNFGSHRIEALAGYSYLYNVYDGFNAGNGNFSSTAFKYNNLGNGTFITETDRHASIGSYKNDETLVGFFGRVSYGYADKYNALLSIRREGSSKFGEDNKWATFPSVSLGWNVNKEDFLKGVSLINSLKLRAGYGVTGITPSSSYLSQKLYAFDSYGDVLDANGNWIKSLMISQNNNSDLKWETTKEINIGIDFSILNERISGSIDIYNKKTTDLLYTYSVPVPPNLYSTTLCNVGDMSNKGIEIMLSGVPVQNKDFQWTTTVTLSHNKNKLEKLSNDLYETDDFHEVGGLGEPISVTTHCMEVGHSLGDYWGLKFVGVSANGIPVVEAKDSEGNWVYKEWTSALNVESNRQRLGNGLPKVYLGWTNNFNYKDFDLSMTFTGQFGYKILNAQRCYYENNNQAYNRLESASDTYGAIDLNGDPVLDADGNQVMVTLSSTTGQGFWSNHLENGDFLKLSSVTLGYKIPVPEAVKNYIKGARVYVSANNVFCITGYSGIDPEVENDYMSPGIDYQDKYPTVRSFYCRFIT